MFSKNICRRNTRNGKIFRVGNTIREGINIDRGILNKNIPVKINDAEV